VVGLRGDDVATVTSMIAAGTVRPAIDRRTARDIVEALRYATAARALQGHRHLMPSRPTLLFIPRCRWGESSTDAAQAIEALFESSRSWPAGSRCSWRTRHDAAIIPF
jgi:hypothetical protein